MKKMLLPAALLLSAAGAGYVALQNATSQPKLASLMPGGALLYLEAPDFGNLLRDWDASKFKADWLQSANYAVYSRSNLFTKLEELYQQYGAAAGFLPDLKGVIELAGKESALALYEVRDVEFLYVSRIADGDLMKSRLWAVREKFEQRQAGGVSFYLRADPASKRIVAFAFAKGYLLIATRDDLVARALELMNGSGNPSTASDRWYHDAVEAAPNRGELRLVMNLESIVKSVYFRSYWVQRNTSLVRQYWAAVADVKRSGGNIVENRVFLRAPDSVGPAPTAASSAAISSLVALVPPDAGLYRASYAGDPAEVAALIVQRLAGPQPQIAREWRDAPAAVSADLRAGTEADLETHIDEQPLPPDAGNAEALAAARTLADKVIGHAHLLVQSSAPPVGPFVQLHTAMVLDGSEEWDARVVRNALALVAGRLWTTSQLGAGWLTETLGRHSVEHLDGLGTLAFAVQGRLLFLSNDPALLASLLDRIGTSGTAGSLAYAAGFRHLRERANYERIMKALDFSRPAQYSGIIMYDVSGGLPTFFSGNIASLSHVLSKLSEIRMSEEQTGAATLQTVVYQMAP